MVNMEQGLKSMVGKVFKHVVSDDESLMFVCEDGTTYHFYHMQDCCENVYVYDIVGELGDLTNTPLLVAEEQSNVNANAPHEHSESFTWTYYKFATKNGYVDVRFVGESNGYYSESVDLFVYKGNANDV